MSSEIPADVGDAVLPCAALLADADPGRTTEPVPSEDEAGERIRAATARCEAPIKPQYLLSQVAVQTHGKRQAPEEPGKGKGKDGQWKKRRGQNKAKDREGNISAMRSVRATQLCSRLAYTNFCGGVSGSHGEKKECKENHDVEEAMRVKLPQIADACPVLQRNGICAAGLNCRFGGHIVAGKNVDRDGVELTPTSPWTVKVPGIGSPLGEANAFGYDVIVSLRKRSIDFSRTSAVVKAWQRHMSNGAVGEPDKPIGVIEGERRPIDFRGKTVLAPLTTVGNLPFRRLCVKLGCEVTVGEMALARTILDGGPAELSLLRRHESEKCFGVQVAGGDVEEMTKVAQFVEDSVDCDFVDINCGCPLDEVHKFGAGSRLMSRGKHMEGIVRCMSSVLRSKHLTLKMRTAHFEDKKADDFELFHGRTAHKLIPKLESWGVSAIVIHGRTARQRYTKLADWDYVHECSKRITRNTPLIACGDVLSWEECQEHRRSHGADAVMVGRGALMKPWLFTEINDSRHWDISANERFDLMRDFVHYGLDHWGADARGVETTRRFLLEWMSFSCRYVPVGLLEQLPSKMNWRPRPYVGRSDLETKLASQNAQDWVEMTESLLGKVPDGFSFVPKHKSSSYEKSEGDAPGSSG
uniref:tRNA-dihydrouridine(47) synthase [NAD(P)(+)] n=1 Tax=Noctiluca scintillans TaxID=2966 RepID=A0A7S1ANZ2_NOCSC|mmetsp:Transcript_53233/g.142424  ORF Transcript_53233/g.142424 Transcript_53233/m.142424 type:complete len:639 (+) Transcript_53233:84-2000(+)|eukprot:CAMPEP_0194540048 /NCGR_PEP_ID=MMETSP0253-20130528/80194_1 /TAXON_ID=2966 /ORGANISM="Noctiluca scintillans" /LENGTH=638 /DNA_ID=CAMNT_0039386387 /DNA_START=42 /DNA_END=1958 /DNA_ORIENTATION=-